MSSIVVSDLAYAPPGADQIFFDVNFGVSAGEHAAIVGANGAGKSTILKILSGVYEADEGEFTVGGNMLSMTQDVGMSRPDDSLRDMLVEVAPKVLRDAGRALIAAEAALADGTDDGMGYAEALGVWGDLGGYELEAQWAAAAQRSVKTPVDDFARLSLRCLPPAQWVGSSIGGRPAAGIMVCLLSVVCVSCTSANLFSPGACWSRGIFVVVLSGRSLARAGWLLPQMLSNLVTSSSVIVWFTVLIGVNLLRGVLALSSIFVLVSVSL